MVYLSTLTRDCEMRGEKYNVHITMPAAISMLSTNYI